MHSERLRDTALWQVYREKLPAGSSRGTWTENVYDAAREALKDVRRVFPNYTLHDEMHILNVMDAMAGLLGDAIGKLTVGELELLILAACMHDLGMVYQEEEIGQCFADERGCRDFLLERSPDLIGCPAKDWPEEIQQWYLRTLHPFRLPEVLENEAWEALAGRRPSDTVPLRCVLAVCEAHGQEPRDLKNNADLEYLAASDVDPLFCALLLRLGDLLDFDDTRAPEVLYGYTAHNPKSREEWDKHRASAGFCYPPSPSMEELPYRARCSDPGVEHAVRDFLDWVDAEFAVCAALQRYCHADWQRRFLFPRAVRRDEIESDGYMSGDFRLTMNQEQILKLLTGENLYDSRDVFVRELLQNAIDAVLLRGEMDSGFVPEESRIDLWEWNDAEGNIWFRIDDRGTGMTLGMLQRYFLKVGNSYYVSKELERDLREHGKTEDFCGISRFGIGFLSCFLCCEAAEISTLYFDPAKNGREMQENARNARFGLRLSVTGLSGYYTLKNQALRHPAGIVMPGPECGIAVYQSLERRGYRDVPGTSIALRLNPGKLGTLNLRGTVEKYLCCARVPVYYNNRRVGQTYGEFMQAVHRVEGMKCYELTAERKKHFDHCFPVVRGQYPRIVRMVVPLDKETEGILSGVSGALVEYDFSFGQMPEWKVKDQIYTIRTGGKWFGNTLQCECESCNKELRTSGSRGWDKMADTVGQEKMTALENEFEKYDKCPTKEELGEALLPFSDMELKTLWRHYCDRQQYTSVVFGYSMEDFPDSEVPEVLVKNFVNICAYQGVVAERLETDRFASHCHGVLLLAGNGYRPKTEVSRSGNAELPLEILAAVDGICAKYGMGGSPWTEKWNRNPGHWFLLRDWRRIRASGADVWLREYREGWLEHRKMDLQYPPLAFWEGWHSAWTVERRELFDDYAIACFQDHYQMTIRYANGQSISFSQKEEKETEDAPGLFPPLLWCRAADDESRRFFCCERWSLYRGITADHPFAVWLLENAAVLNQYYPRQFLQIAECLCEKDAKDIMETCNAIREQFLSLPVRHGVDVSSMPQLGAEDFYVRPE